MNKLKEFSEKLKEFSEKLKDFLKNSRFRQLELVTVAEKRPKKKPGLLPFLFRIGLGRLIVPQELNKDGLTSSAGCAGWPP